MNYLIKDTTKEERKKIVEKALSISLSGSDMSEKDVLNLVNDYIDGKRELDEIQRMIISKYKKTEGGE